MAFKFPFTNYHELNLTWILEQLKSLFEQSEENVTTIETYENRLTAVETELPGISETASEASRAAAAAGTLAQTATQKADTAQENAVQAQGLAGTARNEAEAAQTAANQATQAAQQAQATAQNFDGRITQAENDASQALEASRSFENRVQSAITTANNANQTATNAQGIAMRADQNAGAALDKIGDLSQLTTTAKNNLVVAINEAAQSGATADGKAEDAQTAAANIAGSIAPVEETATASQSYTVNDLLMYNNKLYKVVSAIAAEGALIPGTNITETSVDIELNNIDSTLSDVTPFPLAELFYGLDFASNTVGGREYFLKGNTLELKSYLSSNFRDLYVLTGRHFYYSTTGYSDLISRVIEDDCINFNVDQTHDLQLIITSDTNTNANTSLLVGTFIDGEMIHYATSLSGKYSYKINIFTLCPEARNAGKFWVGFYTNDSNNVDAKMQLYFDIVTL